MARQPRLEYAGAFYHVMARGDRREAIVEGDEDREIFLKTMAEACLKTGWKIHAWVLMENHYHWALETPEPNLVTGMKWFQNTYTRRINSRHKLWGHIFGGRYKSIVVESSKESVAYLGTLIDYIHLNPVRAKLVRVENGKGILDYTWSSLSQGYGVSKAKRTSWMSVEKGLAAHQLEDSVSGRRQYVKVLENTALSENNEQCGYCEMEGQTLNSTLQRGWYWGSQGFKDDLLTLTKGRKISNRNYRGSAQVKAESEIEAEEWIMKGKKHFGITEKAIESTPGTFKSKVAIAWAIHARTTVSQRWIAERLTMRSASNVSQQIRRWLVHEGGKKEKLWRGLVKKC